MADVLTVKKSGNARRKNKKVVKNTNTRNNHNINNINNINNTNNIFIPKLFKGSPAERIHAIKNEIFGITAASASMNIHTMKAACALMSKYLYDIFMLDRTKTHYLPMSKVVFDFQRNVLGIEINNVLQLILHTGINVMENLRLYDNLAGHYNTLVPLNHRLLSSEQFISIAAKNGMLSTS